MICPHCQRSIDLSGAAIRAAREKAKLGLREAARLCKETPQNWSAWENGKRTPRPETALRVLGKLARAGGATHNPSRESRNRLD